MSFNDRVKAISLFLRLISLIQRFFRFIPPRGPVVPPSSSFPQSRPTGLQPNSGNKRPDGKLKDKIASPVSTNRKMVYINLGRMCLGRLKVFYLSIHPSINLSFHSIHPSIHPYIHPSINTSIDVKKCVDPNNKKVKNAFFMKKNF